MLNILILSVGTRNKIIQYFKKELSGVGRVIATDCSNIAPALYEADSYYIVPKITDEDYLPTIIDICKKEKVSGVLSLIDPELSLIAKNVKRFSDVGVTVIGSDYDICERTLNKWEMYNWLNDNGYNCAKTYINKEEFYNDIDLGMVNYPAFVKPVCGSASISVSKVYDRETIEALFAHDNNLLIQEYLDGQEIGADCYIDMISNELVSVFTKKKLVMRAGETDKSVSFKNAKLFDLIKRFCEDFGFKGQIDIDIFDINGEYYISEVNPRFGGGYPHAYECGVNSIKFICNNLNDVTNKQLIGNYEDNVYMMKYSDVMIKRHF